MQRLSLMSTGTPLFYFKIEVLIWYIFSGQSLNETLLSLLCQRNYLKWTKQKNEFCYRLDLRCSLASGVQVNLVFFFCSIVVKRPWLHCGCCLSLAPDKNNIWLLWVNPWAPESCRGQTQRPCCKHLEQGYNAPRTRQTQALPGKKGHSSSSYVVQDTDTWQQQQLQLQQTNNNDDILERLSNIVKPKPKLSLQPITKRHRQSSEPIKNWSYNTWLTWRAGIRVWTSHDWLWFYFWLDKKVAWFV